MKKRPNASSGPTEYLFRAKTRGFYTLRTKTWGKDSIQWSAYCPHVFVTNHGARGASQQLPYPPGWRGDIINITKTARKQQETDTKSAGYKILEPGTLIVVDQ